MRAIYVVGDRGRRGKNNVNDPSIYGCEEDSHGLKLPKGIEVALMVFDWLKKENHSLWRNLLIFRFGRQLLRGNIFFNSLSWRCCLN